MKNALRRIALSLALLPGLADAQVAPTTLPANTVLGRTGIGPGPAQAIPFAQLSQFMFGTIVNNSVLGNVSGGSAFPSTLTGTQLTTLCSTFTSSLKGCVPASGGGTVSFLRADGSFALPPASSVAYTPLGTGGVATTVKIEWDRAPTTVLDYGAVCDGVTNDATAIQNAYNAVKGTGRPLRLPTGTCLITSSLTFDTANSVVTGSGPGSIIKISSVAADGVVISAGNQIFTDFAVTSSTGARTGAGIHTTTGATGIVLQRLQASGHKFGFWITSPAVYFSDSVSGPNNNYGVFYDNTTGGGNINESQIMNVQSNSNAAGGGFAFNCNSSNNGLGIFGFRLTAAANTGDGITIAGGASLATSCNDIFFTGIEMSFNTVNQVNAVSNPNGTALSISNGFIEGVNTVSSCGVCAGTMTLVSISGTTVTGSYDNIKLAGSGNSISGVMSAGAANSALRLGNGSLHTSISGFQTSNVGSTNLVGLLIDAGAGSFVCGGSDFSQATTPRSGTVPGGSITTPCAGPL